MDRFNEIASSSKRRQDIDRFVSEAKRLDSAKLKSVAIHIKRQLFHTTPKNSEELWKCVKSTFGIEIPYTSTHEQMNAPYQWFSDLYFGRATISVAVANRGGAKALSVDTPIYTTSGWKTMGTLLIGDEVFGIDGRPHRVTDVSEIFINNNCYNVYFSDGTNITADAEHRWEVGIDSIYSNAVKTTQEISKEINVLDKNNEPLYYLPKYRPLKIGNLHPETDLGILVEKVKSFPNRNWDLAVVRSSKPHDRVAFIGELFYDGRDYVERNDRPYYFYTDSEGLADSIIEICYLSGCSGIRKAKNGEQVELIFDLADNKRFITKVEKSASVATRCISVDAPRNLYLAGKNFVPTHNTYSSVMLNALWGTHYPGSWSIHAAGTRDQAQVASRYLFNMSRDDIIGGTFNKGKTLKLSATFKNGSNWSIATGTMEGVSGQHPNILTLDEIEFWDIEAVEQAMGVPVQRDGAPKILAMFSTRQRCLPGYTRIITEDGPMKISKLVNTKYKGKVKSYNYKTNQWEWHSVINWYRSGSSKKWYKIYIEYTGLGKGCELIATGEHYVYYDINKKKPLQEFTEKDSLCVSSWKPSYQQRQVIYGTMLGDATIQKGCLKLQHSYKQFNYLQWKTLAISTPIGANTGLLGKVSKVGIRNDYGTVFETCAYTHRLYKEWYPVDRKIIPKYVWEELDELGLAIWLMDDGSYRKAGTKNGGDTWHIYTQCFNEYERVSAEEWFNAHGIFVSWYMPNKDKPGQLYAYIGGESARRITKMVSPYIDVSKHLGKGLGYKKWVANDPDSSYYGQIGIERIPISKIEVIETEPMGCYDIEVEETHNYCNGSNILVSNSFGSMNWLVDEAPKRGFKLYMWSAFETMERCKTCKALDEHPHGSDEQRMKSCNLWDDCYGKRGTKSTGWVKLSDVQEFKRSLGGSGSRQWETQGLCMRPSSHGLVMHNFEHKQKPEGNYCDWEYRSELPLYVSHDPAEGKRSVMYFIQLYEDQIYIFDEIVQEQCSDTTESKEALYSYIIQKGWAFPELLVVDPKRPDAASIWRKGTATGTGLDCQFNAVCPLQDEEHGGQRIEMGVDYTRRLIKEGNGNRRLFINPKNCPTAITAVREYHYKVDKSNNILSDTPDKEWSDEIDPIRYFCQHYTFVLRKGGQRKIRFFGSM